MADFTFLSAASSVPLTKTKTSSYPHVLRFNSAQETGIKTLSDLRSNLLKQASNGACLLKGNVSNPLINESRARSTNRDDKTDWLCLDIDGIKPDTLPGWLLQTAHIRQPSASSGIKPGIHEHWFFLLSATQTPQELKSFLMWLNLETPELCRQITLTRTGHALHWPVDITVAQNDKLIYIAPREDQELVFVLEGSENSIPRLVLPSTIPSLTTLNKRKDHLLARLRKEAGLPVWQPEWSTNHKVIINPESASVTGRRVERGFVYYNLNGGDSWGYYHPADDATILYNFKGEPPYLMEALCPGYGQPAPTQESLSDEQRFIFRDSLTDTYYTAIYQPPLQLELSSTGSLAVLKAFLGDPKAVPKDYKLRFEFDNPQLVDHEACFVNRFVPTHYLLEMPRSGAYPTLQKLLRSLTGDELSYTRFLNWMAYIIQFRKRPHTAWVFHGIEGTGKGLLFKHILVPIFGRLHCSEITTTDLRDSFNEKLETSVIIFIDESETSRTDREAGTVARIKNLITDDYTNVRRMHHAAYMGVNNANFIIASNERHPLHVPLGDRRFNLGTRQEHRLEFTEEEFSLIETHTELGALVHHLRTLPIDVIDARTALQTNAKLAVQAGSTTALDEAIKAFQDGNLAFFIEALPAHATAALSSVLPSPEEVASIQLIEYFITSLEKKVEVARDDVKILFSLCVGHLPEASGKFTQMVQAHHGLELKNRRVNGVTMRAASTTWHLSEEEGSTWNQRRGLRK